MQWTIMDFVILTVLILATGEVIYISPTGNDVIGDDSSAKSSLIFIMLVRQILLSVLSFREERPLFNHTPSQFLSVCILFISLYFKGEGT